VFISFLKDMMAFFHTFFGFFALVNNSLLTVKDFAKNPTEKEPRDLKMKNLFAL
jgi:hypothetical protein